MATRGSADQPKEHRRHEIARNVQSAIVQSLQTMSKSMKGKKTVSTVASKLYYLFTLLYAALPK